jgi:hypothetical protein
LKVGFQNTCQKLNGFRSHYLHMSSDMKYSKIALAAALMLGPTVAWADSPHFVGKVTSQLLANNNVQAGRRRGLATIKLLTT